MTDELKLQPCPFCGGRADIVRGGADEEIWPHRAFSRAFCTGCQARQLFHKTDADAAAAWNIRANVAHHTAAKDAEIERLREDSARLDWLSKLDVGICHLGYGDYRWYTYANPVPEHGMLGLREAIDAAREDRNG